jgi:ElaB/YqjD/DUF883 family membrane-anchored ribosome-binding protein
MFNRWKAHRTSDRARDLFDDSREFARDKAAETNSFIHERPVAATILGVGAGIAFGMIYGSLRRRVRPEPAGQRRTRPSTKRRKPARA